MKENALTGDSGDTGNSKEKEKKTKKKKIDERRETRNPRETQRTERTERGAYEDTGLGPGKTSTAAPTPVAEAEGAENIDKDETANSSSRESTTSDFSDDFCSGVYAI